MNTVLIMAGGTGTRFWPLSRKESPKQFLYLTNNKRTLLQETVDRAKKLVNIDQIFISTNQHYVKKIKDQIPDLPIENIIVEPHKRNTAPAIGFACLKIKRKYPNTTMAVLPSDHQIKEETSFLKTLKKAYDYAIKEKSIITIGIKPNRIETGYGYIEVDRNPDCKEEISKVKKFTEKPNRETAKRFVNSGNYLWNSGIFIWQLDTIIKKIESYLPNLYSSLKKIDNDLNSSEGKRIVDQEFLKMDSISIDKGVLEKENNIYVLPANFGWNDLGSWRALEDIKKKDKNNNISEGNYLSIETEDSIIINQDDSKIVTVVGGDNLIIVNTDDALLVCDKKKAQKVKELRELLAKSDFENYL